MPLHHAAPKAALLATLGAPAQAATAPAQGGPRFAALLQQAGLIPRAGTAALFAVPAPRAAPSSRLAPPAQAAPARTAGTKHQAASPASSLVRKLDQPPARAMPIAAPVEPPLPIPRLAAFAAPMADVSRDVQHGPAFAATVKAALMPSAAGAPHAPAAPNQGEAVTQPVAVHSNVNAEQAPTDGLTYQARVPAPAPVLQPAATAPVQSVASGSIAAGVPLSEAELPAARAAPAFATRPAVVQTQSASLPISATAAGASSDRQIADRGVTGPGLATASITAASSAPSSQPASAVHAPTLTTIAAVLAAADTAPAPVASSAPGGSPADAAMAAAPQTPAAAILAVPNVSPAPSPVAAPARPRSSTSAAPVAATPVQTDAPTPRSEATRAQTQPVAEQPTGEEVGGDGAPFTAPEAPGTQVPDAARSTPATPGKAPAEPPARHAAEPKTASDRQASATPDVTTANTLPSAPAANTQVPAALPAAEAGTRAVTSTSAATASGQAGAQAQAHAPPAAQLAQSVAALHMAGAGARQVTINLTPGTLGAVQVHIARGQDGAAVITLQVEKPETLRTLQQDSAHLHQALDRAGLPSAGRQVSYELAQGQAGAGQNNAGASAGGGGSDGQNRRAPQPQSQPVIGQDPEPRGGLGERAPTPMRTRPAGASGINITA